jgi:hypothetical protein
MTDLDNATKVLDALRIAEQQPPQEALPELNALAGLVQGDPDQSLEVQEARADAFMAICEIGKALHRQQPSDQLWGPAINAVEKWKSLAR